MARFRFALLGDMCQLMTQKRAVRAVGHIDAIPEINVGSSGKGARRQATGELGGIPICVNPHIRKTHTKRRLKHAPLSKLDRLTRTSVIHACLMAVSEGRTWLVAGRS